MSGSLPVCISAFRLLVFAQVGANNEKTELEGFMRLQLGPESGLVRGMPRTRDRTGAKRVLHGGLGQAQGP